MDLLAVGTPVIDLFAKASDAKIARLRLRKGATNFFPPKKLAAIGRGLSGKVLHRYPGDNARNVCEGFAALGGSCGFAGAIGSDKEGAEFASNLHSCNVEAYLQKRKGSTGRIIALLTPDNERTFCADLGASTRYSVVDRIACLNARMLFVSSITLCGKSQSAATALAYMDEFRRMGKKIAISVESPPLAAANRAYLLRLARKYADALFLNEEEARALFGQRAEAKLYLFKPNAPIYLKRGAKGSTLYHRLRRHFIAPLGAKAVDSTGAGDAYAAGALYGLCRGYSPFFSGKIGCYLATKVVGKLGAGIPLGHTRMRLLMK